MAFQSGSQVNPALGRTDFTPFLQGAMQGAQAQARGAELIGQGLAGLGQQVASGIEKYYKKEEEKKVRKEGIDFIVRNFNVDEKAAAAGLSALGPQIIPFLQGEKERQRVEQSSQYAGLLEQSGGAPVSLESGPISSVAQQQGRAMYLDNLYKQSQIAKNLREKAGVPGVAMTPAEVSALPAGTDYKGTPMADGNIYVTGLSRFAPPAQTNFNIGDKEAEIKLESFGKEVDRIIQTGEAARQVAPAINSLLGLLDSGKLQTGFGEGAKAQMRSVGKAIGFPVDEAALGNAQQANAMFGQMILQYYQQTKGSISNAENILFQSFGPELGKSPEANKAILTFSKKRNELDRDLEKIAKDYRLGKLDRQQAQEKIVSRQERYDNDIGSLIPEVPAATNNPKPNQAAINYLQQNPNARAAFDEKYGAGAAKQVLGN